MTTAGMQPQSFSIAGVPLSIWSDDRSFVDEFRLLFDGADAGADGPQPPVELHLSARERTFIMHGDSLDQPAAFLAGFSSPDIPIRWHSQSTESRPALAVGSHEEPVFTFDGGTMHFADVPRWRRMLAHVAFLRLLRLRPDAIFLHAASIAIDGRGVLFLGPKGAGKTTLSSALATRGHAFLGDETAMVLPATMTLVPFRRPLAIKPGPAAAVVMKAMRDRWSDADPDGVLRVPIGEVTTASEAAPVPLRAIVFLRGFEARPRAERIQQPGRDEAALLQPLGSSLGGDDSPRRVFAMFRLLASSTVFHLHPGDPDDTATLVEELIRTL